MKNKKRKKRKEDLSSQSVKIIPKRNTRTPTFFDKGNHNVSVQNMSTVDCSNPNTYCYAYIYYKHHQFAHLVTFGSSIDDQKFLICGNWRTLNPSDIVINYIENDVKVPVIADFQLHGLAALHFPKKAVFFEMHVECLYAGACSSSTFKNVDNNSELIRATRYSYETDGKEDKKYVRRKTCGGCVNLRSPKVSKKLVHNLIHERVMHNPLIKPRKIADYIKVGAGVKSNITMHIMVWNCHTMRFLYNDATQTFERLFIAISAFIEGFYPLAYALVTGEDVDNWDWFMRNLKNIVDDRPITFMSDCHEGLSRSIPAHFPTSHHGYCYYYLQGNLPIRKSDEKYKEVMDCFKKTTYALTPARYEESLMKMELMGRLGVAKYCRNIPREHWSSAFFTGYIFGQTTSSVAESFNNWIQKDKRFPSCALVDMIRSHTVDMLSKTCTFQRYRVYGFPCSHATSVISAKGDRYVYYIQDYFKVTNFQHMYSIDIRPVPNYNRPEHYEP
ncbi:hypothetical protein C5167_012129 [Papaver somniferum]|uniref:Zinc finger PMZ-type domain-containing protein n=1 Tax=Papaver somniferum TaxID=3469 RepID=A0A4Y7IWK7_PAPSO|nr:hypothetical protein C5167_012129 [Papaver somniferum]